MGSAVGGGGSGVGPVWTLGVRPCVGGAGAESGWLQTHWQLWDGWDLSQCPGGPGAWMGPAA